MCLHFPMTSQEKQNWGYLAMLRCCWQLTLVTTLVIALLLLLTRAYAEAREVFFSKNWIPGLPNSTQVRRVTTAETQDLWVAVCRLLETCGFPGRRGWTQQSGWRVLNEHQHRAGIGCRGAWDSFSFEKRYQHNVKLHLDGRKPMRSSFINRTLEFGKCWLWPFCSSSSTSATTSAPFSCSLLSEEWKDLGGAEAK